MNADGCAHIGQRGHALARHVLRTAPTSATVQLDPRQPSARSAPTSTTSAAAGDGGGRR